jgi:hypothetical protein
MFKDVAPSSYCPDLFYQSVLLKAETGIDTGAGVRVADPHTCMRIRIKLFTSMLIRIQPLFFKRIRIRAPF